MSFGPFNDYSHVYVLLQFRLQLWHTMMTWSSRHLMKGFLMNLPSCYFSSKSWQKCFVMDSPSSLSNGLFKFLFFISSSSIAYIRTHSFAFSTNCGLLCLYSWDMSAISPSSGLGSETNNWMEVSTVERLCAGFQEPCGGDLSTSRHIRPAVSIFGWYIFVTKWTWGGSKGYLSGTLTSNLNIPPS